MRFGFNDVWWPTLVEKLDWLRWMGCDSVRFGVGTDTWAVDEAVKLLEERQIRAYLVLGGWNPAPDPEAYAAWVGSFADRYRRSTICLWNEPNYHSDTHPNPLGVGEAIALNLAGAAAAKAVNPEARVLYSPVGPTGAWEDYFSKLYEALPKGDVAMHIYPGGPTADRLGRVREDYRLGAKYGRVHVTEIDMAARWLGDPNAPKLTAKAYALLDELGANTAIFNSIVDHWREARALRQARGEAA